MLTVRGEVEGKACACLHLLKTYVFLILGIKDE